jgi:imidazolonepropionase-like amidohydrolase
MEALQAATSNAARFMGQLDRRGTIETAKIADLVLLDKNPLADIHNTRSIRAVVLQGKLMPRAALDAMLAEAEALAAK